MLILFRVRDNYDRILFSPTKSRKVLAGAKVKKEDLGYKLPVFEAHLFEGSQWFISKSNCSSGTNPTARHVTYACKWTVRLPTKGALPYCRSESGSKGPESTCILINMPRNFAKPSFALLLVQRKAFTYTRTRTNILVVKRQEIYLWQENTIWTNKCA